MPTEPLDHSNATIGCSHAQNTGTCEIDNTCKLLLLLLKGINQHQSPLIPAVKQGKMQWRTTDYFTGHLVRSGLIGGVTQLGPVRAVINARNETRIVKSLLQQRPVFGQAGNVQWVYPPGGHAVIKNTPIRSAQIPDIKGMNKESALEGEKIAVRSDWTTVFRIDILS